MLFIKLISKLITNLHGTIYTLFTLVMYHHILIDYFAIIVIEMRKSWSPQDVTI